MEHPMQKLNDLSRSLAPLKPDGTLIAVIEMSQSSWLVAGIVPGVERQAETLHVPPILVERIVRYHEYAHAVHHRGVTKSNILPAEAAELLRRNDLSYRSAPEETKEQIAQLATLVVIRTRLQDVSNKEVRDVLDHMLETFFSLMGRQSPRYQLASRTRHDDLPRLRDKLRLLLGMSDARLWPSADFIRRIIE